MKGCINGLFITKWDYETVVEIIGISRDELGRDIAVFIDLHDLHVADQQELQHPINRWRKCQCY